MIKENENKITITPPVSLTESKIDSFRKELTDYNFPKKLKTKKKMAVLVDLSKVDSIDFFGFQHLYSFVRYLCNLNQHHSINVMNKNHVFSDFEKKIGMAVIGCTQ